MVLSAACCCWQAPTLCHEENSCFMSMSGLICSSVPATFSLGPSPSPPARPIITNPPLHLSCHFHSAANKACVAIDSCSLLTSLSPDGETEAHNSFCMSRVMSGHRFAHVTMQAQA
ncbi:hypothetical protein Q8A73_013729 [Channa argus]|nr:hypothetical protein Q8A73_013729 [Channa argus]